MGDGHDTPDVGGGQIDLATCTDIQQLKALAYDRLVNMELLQNELRAINERISQLQMPAMNGRVEASAP